MVEAAQLLTIFDQVIRWIGIAKEDARRDEAAYQEALTKIFKAANYTQNYLANRAVQGQNRDVSHYLMAYYNQRRPHAFNGGLAPVVAEEKLKTVSGII